MSQPGNITFEVCVDSAVGAKVAASAGADRVELCADLLEGGITPSLGSVAWTCENLEIGVMVLVRVRGGDFVYSPAELDIMVRDIRAIAGAGAQGVVIGALRPDGSLDRPAIQAMLEAARPLEVTFHRAFDMCADPHAALEELVELGVDRILTSGRKDNAEDGIELLAQQVQQAAGRLSIMPGGGILPSGIRRILETTGVHEIHFAAPATRESPMQFRNPDCTMGCGSIPGEYDLVVTDPELVREFLRSGAGA